MRRFRWWGFAVALVMVVASAHESVHAKRLGGGRDLGRKAPAGVLQRAEKAPPPSGAARPAEASVPSSTPASVAPRPTPASTGGMSRWFGPVLGMLAGVGLAAWLGQAGLGGGLMTALLLALVVGGVLMLVLRRRAAAPRARFAYAQADSHTGLGPEATVPYIGAGASMPAYERAPAQVASGATSDAPSLPSGFDEAAFLRQAKAAFIRLQGAFDSGDLDDLSEFTAPDLFAELKLEVQDRAGRSNQTDVLTLEALLLGVTTREGEQMASVRFRGMVREHPAETSSPLDEVWNFTRPEQGPGGWILGGIEQVNRV
jgi:predicted lipid-binding transport protein (Tim44 family)